MGKKPLNLQNTWATAKNDDTWYIANKISSSLIAGVFAAITLSYKPTIHAYNDFQEAANLGQPISHTYSALYWFLFVFYSFQALDELVELFSVLTKREKGALGLLFEMNYIMGMVLGIWIVVFVFENTAVPGYEKLYNFLYYQVVIFFIAIVAMISVVSCFYVIEKRTTRRLARKPTSVTQQ